MQKSKPKPLTIICHTIKDVRHHISQLSQLPPKVVVLVPTMGALHRGHLQLVHQAKQLGQVVIVSIFVNPLQFGPTEDFSGYPRTLDTDLQFLQELNVDVVFVPSTSQMYPTAINNIVTASKNPSTLLFEGAHRPNHFDGMLTVVAKLFHIIQPNLAVFGQKDAQQLYLVRQMVTDLNFPLEIIGAETVREPDGLAMSSRNIFLTVEERRLAAEVVPKCLDLSKKLAEQGRNVEQILGAARALVGKHKVRLDYLEVVDQATFLPVHKDFGGAQALVIVAVRIGQVRLLDNSYIV